MSNGKGSGPRKDPCGKAKKKFDEGFDRIWPQTILHKLTNPATGLQIVGEAMTEVEEGKNFQIKYGDDRWKIFVTGAVKHITGGYPQGIQFKTHTKQWYELTLTTEKPGIYFEDEHE